ncbi:hypothetical protein ACXWOF_09965, partial [Streptococcus pyogenes]
ENIRLHKGDQVFVFNNGIDSQFWDQTDIDEYEKKDAQDTLLRQQFSQESHNTNASLLGGYTTNTVTQRDDTNAQQMGYSQN